MKMFKPDEELVNVLLANGYKEVKPDHPTVDRRRMNGRREFALFNRNVTSKTPHIQFTQLAIKENSFQFYEREITDKTLKALICFHKLPRTLANMIHHKLRHEWQINSLIAFIDELYDGDSLVSLQISGSLREKILAVYENVTTQVLQKGS